MPKRLGYGKKKSKPNMPGISAKKVGEAMIARRKRRSKKK